MNRRSGTASIVCADKERQATSSIPKMDTMRNELDYAFLKEAHTPCELSACRLNESRRSTLSGIGSRLKACRKLWHFVKW